MRCEKVNRRQRLRFLMNRLVQEGAIRLYSREQQLLVLPRPVDPCVGVPPELELGFAVLVELGVLEELVHALAGLHQLGLLRLVHLERLRRQERRRGKRIGEAGW